MENYKFSTLEYKRPDLETRRAKLAQWKAAVGQAESYEALRSLIFEIDHESCELFTQYSIAHIRHTTLGLIIITDADPVCVDRFQIVQGLIQRMNHVSLHVIVFYIPAAGSTRARPLFQLCSVYNTAAGNARLLQHLISIFGN